MKTLYNDANNTAANNNNNNGNGNKSYIIYRNDSGLPNVVDTSMI